MQVKANEFCWINHVLWCTRAVSECENAGGCIPGATCECLRFYLCTDETEMACDRDFVINKEDSGMPFDALVHGDLYVVGPSNADHTTPNHLLAMVYGVAPTSWPPTWALPIQGKPDPRYHWKIEEFDRLRATNLWRLQVDRLSLGPCQWMP